MQKPASRAEPAAAEMLLYWDFSFKESRQLLGRPYKKNIKSQWLAQ
jgi:hypothetical protein